MTDLRWKSSGCSSEYDAEWVLVFSVNGPVPWMLDSAMAPRDGWPPFTVVGLAQMLLGLSLTDKSEGAAGNVVEAHPYGQDNSILGNTTELANFIGWS